MWPAIAFLLLIALVVLHFAWRKRLATTTERLTRLEAGTRTEGDREARLVARFRAEQDALFNSMGDGVLVLDSSGKIKIANQALLRLTGRTDQILDQTVLEAFRVHPLHEMVRHLPESDAPTSIEIEFPGTQRRCLQINATAIFEENGRHHSTLLVFHDLTRLKQLENTRQEFVANVSHELRTPLSLINGYVETLIGGAKDDPAVLTRFLQTVQKHAGRLACLIEDLLTLSELESGRASLNFRQSELHPIVGRVLDDLQSPAAGKGITLLNSVPPGQAFWGDSSRIQQVLFNLVDNGIKYGRESGTVEVGATPLGDGESMEVWVKDDGAGIPAEAQERIFERFYRVDRARSREQGGTGLGLSIVKHLVQTHRGKVWVDSEVGRGTTFHFTLPVSGW